MGCVAAKVIESKKILDLETTIIWIDSNISNKENFKYFQQLEEKIKNVICKDNVSDAVGYLKAMLFNKSLIISSGSLYPEFIKIFKKEINDFKICPKIIIFTGNKKAYLDRNKNDKELLIDHPFYNSGGVVDRYQNLVDFIEKKDSINTPIKIIYSSQMKRVKTIEDKEFNFEYISKKNQLIFPLKFLNFIEEIDEKEIKNFNEFIFCKYKHPQITPLFEQLISLDKIPNEIISKYWARAYTSNSGFYKDMNKDLRLSRSDNYLIFILMMYEGVKIKSLNNEANTTLYRVATFGKEELSKLKNFFKNKKIIKGIDLPVSIVYSKSFFSFSTIKEEAQKFKGNTLLILHNLNNNSSPGFASIKEYSFYEIENEILVFPFSCFEVKEIKEIDDNNYEITLDYLGKYDNLFEGKTLEELIQLIPRKSKFVKDIFSTNLIKKKYKKFRNISIIYKIGKSDLRIRIFGGNFVINNKNKCHFLYKDKEFELKEFFQLNEMEEEGEDIEQLKIELIIDDDLTDLSHMFDCCSSLISFEDNKILSENEIIKMNHMLYNCTSLKEISCISKWDTSFVTDMSYMFFNCSSLTEIPDISIWDTSNVTNMTYMFYKCLSLEEFPDISNWNLSKVINLKKMFYKCPSLIKKPNLSKRDLFLSEKEIFDRIYY